MHLCTTAAAAAAAAAVTDGIRRMATQQRLWTWSGSGATNSPTIRRVELTVGASTLAFSPASVATAVRALLPV